MNDILKDVSMAHRIVVKVGTSTLTYEHGTMNLKLIDRLSMVLSDLRNQGKEIILVSSGAQGIALGKLGLAEKPKDTKGKQAIAAVGQCELMYLYDKMFSGYNNTVAQVLLTREDIAIPRRKRNIQTVFQLINFNAAHSKGFVAHKLCRRKLINFVQQFSDFIDLRNHEHTCGNIRNGNAKAVGNIDHGHDVIIFCFIKSLCV